MNNKNVGFTLIELLVVIAVLGVLAGGVLVAIDPFEQLAKARDSGMKSSVSSIGKAMEAYGITRNSIYMNPVSGNATFLTDLQTAGEIKIIPKGSVSYTCASAAGKSSQNNFCYVTNGAATAFVVFAKPESKSVKSLCPNAVLATPTGTAWYVYSSTDGRAGVVCTDGAAEPTVAVQTFAGP